MAYAPYNPPSSGGDNSHIYTCDSLVQVGSLVAIGPSSLLVLASSADLDGRTVGVVTEKPSQNQAKISQFYVLGNQTGIVPKQTYFLSTLSGTYSLNPPTSRDSITQIVGEGLSSTEIQITIDPTKVRIN